MQKPVEPPRHFSAQMLDHCLDLFKIAREYKFTLIMEFDRKIGAMTARFSGVNNFVEMRRGSDVDGMRRNIDFTEDFVGKWEMRGRCAAKYFIIIPLIYWVKIAEINVRFIERILSAVDKFMVFVEFDFILTD